MPIARPWQERFLAKISKGPNCWEWTGATFQSGYGLFKFKSNQGGKRAHRLAYKLLVGPIPDGLNVCHHCDNRLCCRPDHLFLGTHADNHADRDRKGRGALKPGKWNPTPRGMASPKAKLTDEAVRKIRSDPRRQYVIAAEYGVDNSTISSIKSRRSWTHLD